MILEEFFHQELQTLHLKTGIKQLKTMMDSNQKGWEDDVDQLIKFMVAECKVPPFDLVGIDIKMGVISSAIIEDKEFIGLNAKFVKKSLNLWWANNKDKYFSVITAETPKPQVEPVKGEAMQKWLDEWKKELDKASNNFNVPKLTDEEIHEEGQERAVEKKYQGPPAEYLEFRSKLSLVASARYKDKIDYAKLRTFYVEGYSVFCESQQAAQEIYIEALTLNELEK